MHEADFKGASAAKGLERACEPRGRIGKGKSPEDKPATAELDRQACCEAELGRASAPPSRA